MNQPSKEIRRLLVQLMRRTSLPVILAKEAAEKENERKGA